MTKTEVTTEAFSVGQQVAGFVLGMPFFLGSLLMLGAGRIAFNSKTWGEWAIGYMLFVVIPAAASLSSALAVFVAPLGQEKAYAKSPALGYVFMLAAFALLISSLYLYTYWPFASSLQVWRTFVGNPRGPIVPMLLAGILLVPGAAAIGHSIGRAAHSRPASILARFLTLCWKMSRKRPLDSTAAPLL